MTAAPLTPEERSIRACLAAHEMHSKHDSAAVAAHGSAAFVASFEKQVDPDGTLPEEERKRRANHALKAHMSRLALAASRARRSS